MKYFKDPQGNVNGYDPVAEVALIHAAVAAGWIDVTGAWPPIPTAADLAAQFAANKTAAIAAVDQFHAATVQQLAGSPTQVEKDSWAMKMSASNAVLNNTPVSAEGAAFMVAFGLSTSAAQTAWATSVRTLAAKYSGLVGIADGLRKTAKAAIVTAADQVSLDAAVAANKTAAQAAIAAFPKV